VYTASLTPGVGFWDTAEMQTVPYIFGVAHPPGFPAFVILGFIFSHAYAVGPIAWRISLFSAIAVAAATWFAFRTMEDAGVHPVPAALASWTFAFGPIVWTRATRAEVHALAILFISVAVWAALRARTTGRPAFLYTCGAFVGLAAATHPIIIWALPGIALLAFYARAPWSKKTVLLAILAAIAPLLLYLYMPLRSFILSRQRLDPTLAIGLPPGQPFWDYGHTVNWYNFFRHLTGAQFPTKGHALTAILHLSSYPAFASSFSAHAVLEFGIPVLVLALVGWLWLAFDDRVTALALSLICLCGVPFAVSYIIEIDYDRYFLTAFWCIAVLAGAGAQAVVSLAARRFRSAAVIGMLSLVLLAAVGDTVYANRQIFAQRNDHSADQFVDRIVRETRPNGIIGAPWVFAAPLAYAAYVERRLDERVIESAEPPLVASRLARWAKQRPVYVIYYETGPQPIPGARQVPIDIVAPPLLYRVVPR